MTSLTVGQKIPPFSVQNEKEEWISDESILGQKNILFFYPKDDTPSCTREACSIRDNYKKIIQRGYVIYGISPDKIKKHNKFIERYEFQYSLLSDPEKKMINDFTMFGPKFFMGKEVNGIYRTTLLINEDNVIEHIISDVKTKEHGEQIINAIDEIEKVSV